MSILDDLAALEKHGDTPFRCLQFVRTYAAEIRRNAEDARREPVAWLIDYVGPTTPEGFRTRVVHTTNAIAAYRDIDPNATVTPLVAIAQHEREGK